MRSILRGEVYWADLGPARGSSPAFRRPIIVVQSDHYNASRLSTIIVVSLTSNRRAALMPGNMIVPAELSGLPADSVANVMQLSTLDRRELQTRVGALPPWLMDDLDRSLRRLLSL